MITVSIKKQRVVEKNFVEKITHRKYKDLLLNKKYLMQSMNRIQSKNHSSLSLSCFDDKIFILNNGYDGLILDC